MRPIRLLMMLLLWGFPLYGQDRTCVQAIVHSIDRDSLQSYVGRLEAFGTRYEFTPQRDSAAEYILTSFSRWGLQPASDWYKFGTHKLGDAAVLSKDSLWIIGDMGVIGDTGFVAFSSDGGASWQEQSTPAGPVLFNGIAMLPSGFGIIVGMGGTILRTTDAGAHWELSPEVTSSYLTSVSFGSPSTGLIIGLSGLVLRTTSAGTSWQNVCADTLGFLRDVQFISPTTAIIGEEAGSILRSTNAGKTWNRYSVDIPYLFSLHFPDSLNGFACGMDLIAKTTDGGLTWTRMTLLISNPSEYRSVFFADSLHGCLVGVAAQVFSTSDGGLTWQETDGIAGTPWGPLFYKVRGISDGRMVVTGNRSLVITSSDYGATWTDCSSALPASLRRDSRNVVAVIPGTVSPEQECILLAHYDSFCVDNPNQAPGANDNATGTAAVLEAARICSRYRFTSTLKFLAVSAEETGMHGSEHFVAAAKKENRTIKGAINADMLGYPIHIDTLQLHAASFEAPNWLVDSAIVHNERYGIGLHIIASVDNAGASDYGPFARGGYDALELAEGTPDEIWHHSDPYYHTVYDRADKLNFDLVRRAAQLMVAVGAEMAGVLGTTGVEDANTNQPKEFLLYQNYPNPFNPTTMVSYQVPVTGRVNLAVYDMLGREVTTLAEGIKPAGSYRVEWNANGQSSGVYFCRLQAAGVVKTMKIVLMK